jgi:hypothetical protein
MRHSFDQRFVEARAGMPRWAADPPVVRAVDRELTPRGTRNWQRSLVRRLVVLDFTVAAMAVLFAVAVRLGTSAPDIYLIATLAVPFAWVGSARWCVPTSCGSSAPVRGPLLLEPTPATATGAV